MAEITSRVNPLFLREEELHQGMELLLFAYRDFMAEADGLLAERGLGRAHHRAAYFIGRHPDISVSELLGLLGDAVGDLEAEDFGRTDEALVMLGQLEDFAAIDALAFEYRRGVMHPVGQYMNARLSPRHQLSVKPDFAIAVVKGYKAHARVLPRIDSPPGNFMVNKVSRNGLRE